jgi:hypothetical protein
MVAMSPRSAVLAVLVAATGLAQAAPADPALIIDDDPAAIPERWRTGVALGADRSGDLRRAARAILDAAAVAPDRALTLADAAALGAPVAAAFEPPPTIRVWRRGLDGSTSSCAGRVDVLPFERYVRGVLPHEWIRSWNAESLKAGAVAIRTYAAYWVGAGGKYECADLDDTTASQVYRDAVYPESDAAVLATAGVYVVRDDQPVLAEYSAENGDPTATGVSEPLCAGRTVNGHGRGTCQWGTQRWAQDGQTWDWIVAHYYPGATLATPRPALAATLTGAAPTFTMASGDEMVVSLEYANDGSATWRRDQIFVGTTGPRDRASAFWKAENWLDPGRPTSVDAEVAPGAVGRFTWAMVAPEVDEPTTFVETFGLVTADGVWFGPADDAVAMTITVTPRETVDGRPEQGGCSAGGGDVGLVAMSLAVALAVASRRRRLAAIAAAAILGCAGPDAPTPGPRYGDAVGGPSELAAVFRQVASEVWRAGRGAGGARLPRDPPGDDRARARPRSRPGGLGRVRVDRARRSPWRGPARPPCPAWRSSRCAPIRWPTSGPAPPSWPPTPRVARPRWPAGGPPSRGSVAMASPAPRWPTASSRPWPAAPAASTTPAAA